jgi:hypothetical protein
MGLEGTMWIMVVWGLILVLGLGSIVGLILLSLDARMTERKSRDVMDEWIEMFDRQDRQP